MEIGDTPPSQWQVYKGTWSLLDENDVSVLLASSIGVVDTIKLTSSNAGDAAWGGRNDPWDNYRISVDMSLDSGRDAGFLYRASSMSSVNDGGQQNYAGLWRDGASSGVVWGRIDDGWNQWDRLRLDNVDYGQVHSVSVLAVGCTFELSLDGVVVATRVEAASTCHAYGSVGLRGYMATASYTAMEVTEVEG